VEIVSGSSMSDAGLILSLGKVLIAAAWADQELTTDEINSLKDLLFHLPQVYAADWNTLELYIHTPVSPAERNRVLQDFLAQLRSQKDKDLAVEALDGLIHLDTPIGEEQVDVINEIKDAIRDQQIDLWSLLVNVVSSSLIRRDEAIADAPNREEHYEDFIKNRVYYSVKRMLDAGEVDLSFPDERLRMLCLAGGLLTRVAHVDENVSLEEEQAMIKALRSIMDVSRAEAALIVSVALSEFGPRMDYYRMTRELSAITSEEERLAFLDLLFSIADADEGVSHHEIEEIRAIARGLHLTHRQFIDAKLKIPSERRAS